MLKSRNHTKAAATLAGAILLATTATLTQAAALSEPKTPPEIEESAQESEGETVKPYKPVIAEGRIARQFYAPMEAESGMTALIRFTLNDSGTVTGAEIAESSGEEKVDEAFKMALSHVKGFPLPADEKEREKYTQNTIEMQVEVP